MAFAIKSKETGLFLTDPRYCADIWNKLDPKWVLIF
jgi:hypothetical protein